jgi:hypothetical protein
MTTLSQLRSGALAGATRLDLQDGLTAFPREIFDLADTLEVLNLSGNALSQLPEDLGRLQKLRILFCSDNAFTELPPVLGECPALRMVGFKANQIETVAGAALPEGLRWLILTDNRISRLPAELGRCVGLQKLMLSGNGLAELPEAMAACQKLELVRLAANTLSELPAWLLDLPQLAWLAFAGNPMGARLPMGGGAGLRRIPWAHLQVGARLGEGASGTIDRALWWPTVEGTAEPVAVKVFKGAVTSDGLPSSEMAACLAAGACAHLIPVKGCLSDHPEGASGLVLGLIDPSFQTLAGPPSFETCTRDVYPCDWKVGSKTLLELVRGLAAAGAHLHERGILHGDFYAHNVLWHESGQVYLGDLGAASFYEREGPQAGALERLEVRAFGVLLAELLAHTTFAEEDTAWAVRLGGLSAECLQAEVAKRPPFVEIVQRVA